MHSLEAMPGTDAPINALRGERPTAKTGCWPAEKDGAWASIEDHRGKAVYMNGKPFTISDFGPFPEGWATIKPEPTQEEKDAQRRIEILPRFSQIDVDSIRPLRALSRGEATGDDKNKLGALDAAAESLRAELAILNNSK